MWVGHYASGLIAKPFAPTVPLWLLALAGAVPDAIFFILQFFGIESFNLDPKLIPRGCFPYSNDYPYSHSLAGMAVTGAALAALWKAKATTSVTLKDQLVIIAATASHFLLEWPVHRKDVKITPHDSYQLGAGLFDHPVVVFVMETVLFLFALWVYATYSPPSARAGYLKNKNRLWGVIAVMICQQAQFCFSAAPTTETRWVHAPLFLGMILGSSWLLGKLEQ
ncbi:hypothetical protein OBBRIDRAFT_766806 [Obba rivulosa]|uniref:Uncharacterized protein n=1 Tax=Obba rivulosa TaxID=1052685 RepID=A0A8E2J6I1_9APHY|nr:hypothetical protein OBBRIDRAFT_766806 [Obba rivulosa]